MLLDPYTHDFGSKTSEATEVAVDPNNFFTEFNHFGRVSERLSWSDTLSERISAKIKGVKFIIGDASQYAELALLHLRATKENLFGSDYDQYDRTNWAITQTTVDKNNPNLVTISFHFSMGFNEINPNSSTSYDLSVAPILVPDGY